MAEKQSKSRLLRRFLPYYKKYWKIVVFDLFCAGLTTVCELILPLIVRTITSAATNDIAALTAEYTQEKSNLCEAYTTATMQGDSETAQSVAQDMADLDAWFDEEYQKIEGGAE